MKLGRNAIIGLVLVLIIAGAFLLPQLLGNDNGGAEPNPGGSDVVQAPVNENVRLGNVVAASSVDRDGCAVTPAVTFSAAEPIYVVAENSDIPQGTTIFVRLYHNDQPIEDAPEITADQDYFNTCVNFVFEPVEGQPFDSGDYQAEFIVNGNQSDYVAFSVQ